MLMELAYRLAIEETPFIQEIRNNIITVMTPASEVDGREKQVDNQRATQSGCAPGSHGAITCSTTTTATASARAWRSQQHAEVVPRSAPDGVP
jgi:hypothetical protein